MSEENTVSKEAFDRVKSERDGLERKFADAERKNQEAAEALRDVGTIEKAYEHFAAQQVPNAYGVAREAILSPKVRSAEPDTLPEALDGWYNHSKAIFGAPAPAPDPEPPARPVAPMTQPNPTAPGTPSIGGAPVMIGSPEYQKRYGGLTREAQLAAHARGEIVFSPEVQAAQSTVPGT
ncbi:MAG: hypothetical protein ABIJ75_10810 [Actinomycetota bacterium]